MSDTAFDWTWPSRSFAGLGSGGGNEKRRDWRSKCAVGDNLLLDMMAAAVASADFLNVVNAGSRKLQVTEPIA